MASSLVKIDIHLVFHVKTDGTTIRTADLPRVFSYMAGVIEGMEGRPLQIGGMPNHVHILTVLPKTMSLVDFVRTLKTNTSKWIKQLDDCYARFAWQDGYGAFSVSPSLISKTVDYIRNQEEHHKKRSFRDEYKLFLEHYGIDYDEKYILGE